jgi:23S rRNA pseudouridine1911/1915/1917 synthase
VSAAAARDGGHRVDLVLPESARGRRLDQTLADMMPGQSRATLQRLIRQGRVTSDGRPARPAHRIRGGERILVEIPPPAPSGLEPEAIALEILHEDADLIAINKPPGLTVHPGAGVPRGTLVNALLHHCRDLSGIGGVERPGIVHRLDRDTSGVLVAAKNNAAHRALSAQFKGRRVRKTYEALVWGVPRDATGRIDAAIGRHPTARTRMAIRPDGREARTAWRTVERFGALSFLEIAPETGRTHQIRVHLASMGHPVVGDPLYGGRRAAPGALVAAAREALASYAGMALHARALEFTHPASGAIMRLVAPRPRALDTLIEALRRVGAPATRTGGTRR